LRYGRPDCQMLGQSYDKLKSWGIAGERAGLRVKPNSAGRNAFEINVTTIQRERHTLAPESPYSRLVMQRAFVVRLGPQTEPKLRRLKGHVEEVDTGEELRFESAAELLRFLGQRFDEARRQANLTNQSRKTSLAAPKDRNAR